MKPIITQAGRELSQEALTVGDLSEMFEFLSDEWKAADTYLDELGFPAQVTDEFNQFEYRSLTKRMMLALGHDEDN